MTEIMTKEVLERISIGLEFVAFFVAAPDFLGEATLAAITKKIEAAIGLWGKNLDQFAKFLLEFKFIPAKMRHSRRRSRNAPTGRIGFIIFIIAINILVYLFTRFGDKFQIQSPPLPDMPSEMIPNLPITSSPGFPFFVILNLVAIDYVFQLLLEGSLVIVRKQGAKGLFFIFGAILFLHLKRWRSA